ncbi:MAG: IS200/IS605 family accessory protein TnpB-related protein [Acidobacteria bacterium]|nr:IS200/IS605 family accessory protein TnpB-related protein [Acidobacteriota bacterium]
MQSTFETTLELTPAEQALLAAQARQLSDAEHKIFVRFYVEKADPNEIKRWALEEFKITARQYNAIVYDLRGRVTAQAEHQKRHAETLAGQIKATKAKIVELEKRLNNPSAKEKKLALEPEQKRSARIRFMLHQKKRRLAQLEAKLKQVRKKIEEEKAPRLCFGSRRLFHAQHHLQANGYASHEEWKADWDFERHSQFVAIGSKDETAGNQSCQYSPETQTIKLRLTDALVEAGNPKYLVIKSVAFAYGQEQIETALRQGSALFHRFVARQRTDGSIVWYLKTTVEEPAVPIVTDKNNGILGVDLNANHLALGFVSGDGNPVGEDKIAFEVLGKSSDQTKATFSEAVNRLVDEAVEKGMPIAVENLDFSKKKQALREKGKGYARMLSAFAYGLFFSLLIRRAARRGVEVKRVNPAYTSIIGYVKFGASYGLSIDGSAAIAIGRRALRMSERPVHRSKSPSLDKIVIEATAAQGKGKHVWSLWNGVRKRLGRDRRSWPGRCPEKGMDGCDQKLSFERRPISSDRTSIAGGNPVAS